MNAEITVATAIVKANCRKNSPEMPPRNAVGIKTALKTNAIDTSAGPTSVIVTRDASRALKPAFRLRSMFSTTTIASSTTMPIANTRPNSVRLFSENPSAAITANVPISETGIATIGIAAARQDCRNKTMTKITNTTASTIVV